MMEKNAVSATTLTILPDDHRNASLVGRVWRPDVTGPALVWVEGEQLFDITGPEAPTMRDLLEMDDPAGHLQSCEGTPIGTVAEIAANSWNRRGDLNLPHLYPTSSMRREDWQSLGQRTSSSAQ